MSKQIKEKGTVNLPEENLHVNLIQNSLLMKNRIQPIVLIGTFALIILLFIQFIPGQEKTKQMTIFTTTDLSYWGIDNPSQIEYVSLGILHKKFKNELIIYNIRKEKPEKKSLKVKTHIPELRNGSFLLDDFEHGITNRLGGYFNEFYKSPSKAFTSIERTSKNNHCLEFQYYQKESGYSGFWIHLFDLESIPSDRVYFNALNLKYLTFFVKGTKGGEKLEVRAADSIWERKEDSLKIGDLKEFLPAEKITTTWQKAWIPLSCLDPRINIKNLASIVFSVLEGHGEIYIDDITFTSEKNIPLVQKAPEKKLKKIPNKGLWLWESKALINNRDYWQSFINFCISTNVNEIFLHLPYIAIKKNSKWNIILDNARLQDFLSHIHKYKIKVHALDGDPSFALKKWHPKVTATIKAIVRYNSNVSPESRFDGIRYDIEPYILPYFSGIKKESIIDQYVTLINISKKITKNSFSSQRL
ncbi:MAG: hypothetical protein ACOC5G_02590 [Acidobacteriota bacterium]